MLGKCIKNEFVNRIGQVAALSVGILVFSGVMCGLNALEPSIDNYYVQSFIMIMNVLFAIAMMAVLFALIFMPCTDFAKRFFKDQGYLTHTLPVKTSTLIVARMICDIGMVTMLAVLYPLCLCIVTRDFEIFRSIIMMLEQFLVEAGSPVERAVLVTDAVLMIIGIWLGMLLSLWSINMAYSFGHAFSKGKRLMSVIGYTGLVILYFVLLVLAGKILPSTGLLETLEGMGSSVNTWACVMLVVDTVELIGVVVLAIATSWICKHKLNLE